MQYYLRFLKFLQTFLISPSKTSKFINRMKHVDFTPVFKSKRSELEISKYPISLTPCENLLHKRLVHYSELSVNKKICPGSTAILNTFTAKPKTLFLRCINLDFPSRFLTIGLTKSKSVVYHLVRNFMLFLKL